EVRDVEVGVADHLQRRGRRGSEEHRGRAAEGFDVLLGPAEPLPDDRGDPPLAAEVRKRRLEPTLTHGALPVPPKLPPDCARAPAMPPVSAHPRVQKTQWFSVRR